MKTRRRGRPIGALFILTAALAAAPGQAQGPGAGPPLVPPALDGLGPSVRSRVAEAYAAAVARPGDAEAVGTLGMLLHAHQQHGAARRYYGLAGERAPGTMLWPYLSAIAAADDGEPLAAVPLFRQAIGLEPEYFPARVRLAAALMAAGNLRASQAEYESLTQDLPELAIAHDGLARALAGQRQSERAIVHYRKAIELAPDFGTAHYGLGVALRAAGASEAAAGHFAAFRKLGARTPVPAEPRLDPLTSMKRAGPDLLTEGARLGAAGRLEEAIALHLRAIALDPADAQAHVNLIALFGRTGRPADAEAHYRAAVALGTSLAEAHYNYGVLLAAAGRDAEAAEAFRRALTVDPFNAAAHNNLGALRGRQGDLASAALHYRRALAADPRHPGARAGLARTMSALGSRSGGAAAGGPPGEPR